MSSRQIFQHLLGGLRIGCPVRISQDRKGPRASSERLVICQVTQMETERKPCPTPAPSEMRFTCCQLVLQTMRDRPLGSHPIHSCFIFLILGDMGSPGLKGNFYLNY